MYCRPYTSSIHPYVLFGVISPQCSWRSLCNAEATANGRPRWRPANLLLFIFHCGSTLIFFHFFLQEPSLNVPFELAVQLIAWKDQPPAERKRKRASNCTKTKQQINDNRTHTHNSGSLNMADSWKWTNQGIDQSCVTGPQRGGRSHFE